MHDQPHPNQQPSSVASAGRTLPRPVAEDCGIDWEHEPTLQPRIWVASLADYAAGRPMGGWIDAAREPEDVSQDIRALLARSVQPGADTWAIYDSDDFGPLQLGDDLEIETVSRVARAVRVQGRPLAAWLELTRDLSEQTIADYPNAFLGSWPSLDDFGRQMLTDLGYPEHMDRYIPKHLRPYVSLNADALVHDLIQHHDIHYWLPPEGRVWVYRNPHTDGS